MEKKLWLIRGQRILNQLNETTYSELERNVMSFTPQSKKRQYVVTPVQIAQLTLIPYAQNGALETKALAHGETGHYEPQMVFSEVEYQDEDTPENVTFMAPDGQDYHIIPIDLAKNNVKVRCTCLDFRWRFAIYNEKGGSLYGPGPGVYQKRTQRPPNNPRGVPGLCKHLMKLVIELRNSQVVR